MTREAFVGALREHLIAYGAQSCAVFSHGTGGEFPNFIVVIRKDGRGKYDPHFSAVLKRRDCTLYDRCFKIEVLSGEYSFGDAVMAYQGSNGGFTEADLAGGATGCCEAVPLLGSDGAPVTVRDEGPIEVVGGEDKEGHLLLPGEPVTWADIVEGVNEDLSGIENGEGENPKISKNEGLGSKILKVVRRSDRVPGQALMWTGDNLDALREFSGVQALDKGNPMVDCLMVPNGQGSFNWGLFNPACCAVWLDRGSKRVRFMDAEVFAEEYEVVNEPSEQKNFENGAEKSEYILVLRRGDDTKGGTAIRWTGGNLAQVRGFLSFDQIDEHDGSLVVPMDDERASEVNAGRLQIGSYVFWYDNKRYILSEADFNEQYISRDERLLEQKISKDSAPAEIRLEGPVTVTTPDGVSAEYPDGMTLDDMVNAGIAKVPAEPKSELFPMTGDFEKDFETAGNMLGPVEVKNEPLFQADTSSLVSGMREEGGTIPQYKGVSAVHPELYEFSCMIGSHIAAWGAEKWRVIQIKKDCFFIILLNKEHNSFLTYISKSSKELFEKIGSCANNVNAADYEASIEYAADKYPGCPFSDGYRDEVSENTTTGTKEQLLHYEASLKKQDRVYGEVFQKTRAAADVLGPWLIEQGATHFRIYELPDKKLAVIALIPCWDTGKSKFDDAVRAANGVVAWMISGTFMAHEKTGYIIGLERHKNYPYIDYVRSGEMAFEHTSADDTGNWGTIKMNQGHVPATNPEASFKIKTGLSGLSETKKRRLLEGEWVYDNEHVKMQSDGTTPEDLDRQAKEKRDPFPGEKPMAEKLEELKNLLEKNERDFNSKKGGLAQVPFPPPYAPDNFDMHTLSGTILAIKTAYNMINDPVSAYGRLVNLEKVKKLLMIVHDALASREKTEILPYGYNQKQLDLFAAEEAKFQKTIGTWNKELLHPPHESYNPDYAISMLSTELLNFITENFDSSNNVWKPGVLFDLNKIRRINYLWQVALKRKNEANEKHVYQEITFNGFDYEWREINRYRLPTSDFIDQGLDSKVTFKDGRVLHVGECLVIYSDNTFEIKSA